MNRLILPTFRRSAFRRPPRSLQAPWGPGMPATYYVLRGDEYDLRIQDASDASSGYHSLRSRRQLRSPPIKRNRRQRGGIHFYPGTVRNNPPASRIAEMQRVIRARHPTNPQRRQRAASRALVNTRRERWSRGINRGLRNASQTIRQKLTPSTLMGKLGASVALGGALAAAPAAFLGSVIVNALNKNKKED